MNEKFYLDSLTQDGVSLRKQKVFVENGQEYAIGEPWRSAYANSIQGREMVESEVIEPYRTAILAVWGVTPTV